MPQVEKADMAWEEIREEVMLLEKTDFGGTGMDESEEELKEVFELPESIKFVARESGRIIGYVVSAPLEFFGYLPRIRDDRNFGEGNTLYVSSIAVLPEHQGKGIGKEMVRMLLEEAKKIGYSRVTGHFLESSARMFQRLGGTTVKSYPGWHGNGISADYMCIDLGAQQNL